MPETGKAVWGFGFRASVSEFMLPICPSLSRCPRGQHTGTKCQILQIQGLAWRVPDLSQLVPGLSQAFLGHGNHYEMGSYRHFHRLSRRFRKQCATLCHRPFLKLIFQSTSMCKCGCTYRSRMGIVALIGAVFNAVMRGLREMRVFLKFRGSMRCGAHSLLPPPRPRRLGHPSSGRRGARVSARVVCRKADMPR